jgi:hypothetical protein
VLAIAATPFGVFAVVVVAFVVALPPTALPAAATVLVAGAAACATLLADLRADVVVAGLPAAPAAAAPALRIDILSLQIWLNAMKAADFWRPWKDRL